MTVPVLGCPSLEGSYPSLANQSSARAKQGKVRKAGVVLLPGGNVLSPKWLMSPRPFHSALPTGPFCLVMGLQFLKTGRMAPSKPGTFTWLVSFVSFFAICSTLQKPNSDISGIIYHPLLLCPAFHFYLVKKTTICHLLWTYYCIHSFNKYFNEIFLYGDALLGAGDTVGSRTDMVFALMESIVQTRGQNKKLIKQIKLD